MPFAIWLCHSSMDFSISPPLESGLAHDSRGPTERDGIWCHSWSLKTPCMLPDDERHGPGTLLTPAGSQPTPWHVIEPFFLGKPTSSWAALWSRHEEPKQMSPAWPRSAGSPVIHMSNNKSFLFKAFCLLYNSEVIHWDLSVTVSVQGYLL